MTFKNKTLNKLLNLGVIMMWENNNTRYLMNGVGGGWICNYHHKLICPPTSNSEPVAWDGDEEVLLASVKYWIAFRRHVW